MFGVSWNEQKAREYNEFEHELFLVAITLIACTNHLKSFAGNIERKKISVGKKAVTASSVTQNHANDRWSTTDYVQQQVEYVSTQKPTIYFWLFFCLKYKIYKTKFFPSFSTEFPFHSLFSHENFQTLKWNTRKSKRKNAMYKLHFYCIVKDSEQIEQTEKSFWFSASKWQLRISAFFPSASHKNTFQLRGRKKTCHGKYFRSTSEIKSFRYFLFLFTFKSA